MEQYSSGYGRSDLRFDASKARLWLEGKRVEIRAIPQRTLDLAVDSNYCFIC